LTFAAYALLIALLTALLTASGESGIITFRTWVLASTRFLVIAAHNFTPFYQEDITVYAIPPSMFLLWGWIVHRGPAL